MTKRRALILLLDIVSFYLEMHNDSKTEPTTRDIKEMEKYMNNHLHSKQTKTTKKYTFIH